MFINRALACATLLILTLGGQTFDARIKAIVERPEYKHSRFGIEIYSLAENDVLYSVNAQELFIPGSTTKILSVGTALEALGPDFRFHTKVYRTGPVKNGTLDGDLVLVASGDPDISGRIQPDGTMVFENEDHSYAGFEQSRPVPGDPLAVIRELASKVAAAGIKRIHGQVQIDISLFPEGARELGTGVVISPIIVNDNLVDVTVAPGMRTGDPATLTVSPQTSYVRIANDVKTAPPGSRTELEFTNDMPGLEGAHAVSLSGTIALDAKPKLRVYRVPSPSAFATTVFREALQAAGIRIDRALRPAGTRVEVAEHVSPPLKEEARITLKVSQNLHASSMPYIVGAYTHKDAPDPLQAGFDEEEMLLLKAGLDTSGAVQNDGAGGDALFAPDFMVHYLLHLAGQPFFPDFLNALPILGKDGTLFNIMVDSPAAGHVHAKTGTYAIGNALTRGGVVTGKGLAGFIDARDGRRLAFAAYINFVPVQTLDEPATRMVGQALGEIAAAAYDVF